MIIAVSSNQFGRRLRSARRKKGISQKNLAIQCGITLYRIRRIEQGLVLNMEEKLLQDLCQAVGSSAEQLIFTDSVCPDGHPLQS